MKTNFGHNNIIGYIEGFYGRLLDWESRKLIINSLSYNKMNTYLYAPKEDEYHRFKWRNDYSKAWRENFKNFTKFSKEKNINVIAGIAPGLDFDFKNYNKVSNKKDCNDFNLLLKKAKQLLKDGATSIALLMDDIPENFVKLFGKKVSEGESHGDLANELSRRLGKNIYFVPRVYADELIGNASNYLLDLGKVLNKDISVFYCGRNIVSKSLSNYPISKQTLSNTIIYWDNFYSNDYCPRRLHIGPYLGRKNLKNFMINPTGLIYTDLLILDIVYNTINEANPWVNWRKTLDSHHVPIKFNNIKKFFLKPYFNTNSNFNSSFNNKNILKAIEYLLWNWKSELSREWYPFLFGLKHDLLIYQNKLSLERLAKTQTLPLTQFIKGENE